jgi:hypothetical protein
VKAVEIGNGSAWDVKTEGWWKAECPGCGAKPGRLCGHPNSDQTWITFKEVCKERKHA